jgi:GntR family transcriptional regulator/MocR family aminotransferase
MIDPDFELDRRADAGLTRQLYDRVRAAILSGTLPPGRRLPSSRALARQLGVARNTVSFAIDQLAMEGYLDTAPGRRPIVAGTTKARLVTGPAAADRRPAALKLSRWAARLRQADWPFMNEGRPRPFRPGVADPRPFPHELWARCLRRAARQASARSVAKENRPSLQAALLRHLAEHRGIKAEAHQIIVTPSAQAAIELIARLVLDAGDLAWLESPGYGGARVALESAGARLGGVPLDRSGIAIAGRSDRPRLIFVTPSHQYPTGRLMSVTRRQELLAFAAHTGTAIIEDDYDSEFHYDGRPVAALQGLDGGARVFYVGTFSKSMFADIRVGYAIVPDALVDVVERAQRHAGQIVSAPLQDALAGFVEDGHFAAHIRRMTRVYRARRDRMVAALSAEAGDRITIAPPPGGMQLLVELADDRDDQSLTRDLAAAGITARPLSRHFTGAIGGQGLFLGFAAWDEREIDAGAAILGRVMRQSRRQRRIRA